MIRPDAESRSNHEDVWRSCALVFPDLCPLASTPLRQIAGYIHREISLQQIHFSRDGLTYILGGNVYFLSAINASLAGRYNELTVVIFPNYIPGIPVFHQLA